MFSSLHLKKKWKILKDIAIVLVIFFHSINYKHFGNKTIKFFQIILYRKNSYMLSEYYSKNLQLKNKRENIVLEYPRFQIHAI